MTELEGPAARRRAALCYARILDARILHDEAIAAETPDLEPRDRRFVWAIVLAALRHKGEIDAVLGRLLSKPLPPKSGIARTLLATAAAQLLFLASPPHAVIDTSVEIAKQDSQAKHFSGLVNAVLRKVAARGSELLAGLDGPRLNTPDWAWSRWERSYGQAVAAQIAAANQVEPAVDISCKADAGDWARRLGGLLLPSGSIRLPADHGPIETLPGFAEGAWWVQDAAAALPALLLGDVRGRTVLDLCAAPGGKTMQLASAGALVTAVDRSERRLRRLGENLARTALAADLVAGNAETADLAQAFDLILLDAPCSATGTVRRHPELLHIKSEADMRKLADVQRRLLRKSALALKAGGQLVYCTCSLEPDEGENQIGQFLASQPEFAISPIMPGEAGVTSGMITPEGFLRTLPFMKFGEAAGMDGFFAARLRRLS